MSERKHFGEPLTSDPDDAPELLEAYFQDAAIYDGDKLIRPARGRGRPKLNTPKEQINIRLDAEVLARLRAGGSGWQTRINTILRESLGLPTSGG